MPTMLDDLERRVLVLVTLEFGNRTRSSRRRFLREAPNRCLEPFMGVPPPPRTSGSGSGTTRPCRLSSWRGTISPGRTRP